MSDITPAPTTPDGTSVEIPIPIDPESAPTKPEHISETLYIQNLNEKIRIDGFSLFLSIYAPFIILFQFSKRPCADFSNRMVRYSTWSHTTTCGCADKRLSHL